MLINKLTSNRIGRGCPQVLEPKPLNHIFRVMLAPRKSMFAMPTLALERHVIVDSGLKLNFERKGVKSDLCKQEFQI
mgnify:CR=1 FL=1